MTIHIKTSKGKNSLTHSFTHPHIKNYRYRIVVVGAGGVGNGELMFTGYRVSVLQEEKSDGDGWW